MITWVNWVVYFNLYKYIRVTGVVTNSAGEQSTSPKNLKI